jgi:hypothetical protein
MPLLFESFFRSRFVKKIYICLFLSLVVTGSIVAMPAADYFISKYEVMDLDFLRTHYFEIDNGRAIQTEGYFSSYKWIPPFQYKERLNEIGFNVEQYNILQFTIKEKNIQTPRSQKDDPSDVDEIHYAFPILLFQTQAGDLHELEQLKDGDRIVIYGKFFNLKKSDYALEVHLIETIKKGGHDRDILIDARIPETPTPTATITATPGPNLWQRVSNMVNPKETATPVVTTTPGPKK